MIVGEYNGSSVTVYELLQKLAAKASYVVAVGQCSSFGGIPAGKGNVTNATSVTEALKTARVATKNPVINLPGCPAHPDWTLITLASVIQGFNPDLDGFEVGRLHSSVILSMIGVRAGGIMTQDNSQPHSIILNAF